MRKFQELVRNTFNDEKKAFLLVFFFTLLVRLPFLGMVRLDPTFQMPVMDSLEFSAWGYQIAHGKLLWTALQNHPPLYAYFLALIFTAVGFNLVAVALIQYVLFALSTALLYLVVARTTNKAIALICSFIMAAYWFFVYANTFVFSENLCLFLDMCFLYALVSFKDDLKKYILAGLILGLSVICRPEMLFFLFLFPFWLAAKNLPIKDGVKYFLAVTAMTLLIMAPVILQNYRISGEMRLRSQVGANIYMGNNPAFKGTNAGVEIGKDWETFISQPDAAAQRRVGEAGADKYFIGATMKIIGQDPLGWLGLIASKTFSILTGREFLRTEDVYVYDYHMIRTPYPLISTKMIYLLGMLGVGVGLFQFRNLLIFYLLLVTYAPAFFFPLKTRYMMPNMPFMIVFAAIAVYHLISIIKNRQSGPALGAVAALAVLVLASYYNPLDLKNPDVSETYYGIAKNYAMRSQFASAVDFFKWTIKVNPKNISAYNDLGVLLMNLKDYQGALSYFNQAMAIDNTVLYPKLNAELCRKLMSGQAAGSQNNPQ